MANTYDAQFGRTGGGTVNTTLKSGTNRWHGLLSEYLRNAIFFETGAAGYDWLNRIIAVGIGRRTPEAAIYEVHQIL